MKICFLISSFPPVVGGAERFTERLSRCLADRGRDVAVVTRRKPGSARRSRSGDVSVYRLGHPSRSKLGALTFGLHALWSLGSRLSDFRILHVQNLDTPLYVGALAAVLLGKKVVVTVHGDPDVLLAGRAVKGKVCIRLIRWARMHVVALTEQTRGRLVSLGVPTDKVQVLPNGVDTDTYRPASAKERRDSREALGYSEEDILFLFVGRLIQSKRVDLLLEAWSDLESEKAHLLIVGTGELEERLRSRAEALSLRRVKFTGFRDDVLPCLHGADVFVLPSDIEGLSVALLEAMAVGLPPVVSRTSGTSAPVRDGDNGLQFTPGDPRALAKALQRLEHRPLRLRLGEKAEKTVRREYSLESVVDRHSRLYSRLGENSGSTIPREPIVQ